MFGLSLRSKVVQDEMEEIRQEIKELRKSKKALEEQLEELKLKKRLEEEEIRHMIKINEERLKQEIEGKKLELEKQKAQDITKLRDEQRIQITESLKEFHTKIEARFGDELKNLKEVYGLLMQRLPNVNLTLTKKV